MQDQVPSRLAMLLVGLAIHAFPVAFVTAVLMQGTPVGSFAGAAPSVLLRSATPIV